VHALILSLGLFTFGFGETLLVFAVLVLLFGAKKLPGLARGLGEGIRNFKGELKGPPKDDHTDGE
jgi:sec-independent protein translocase protein TatA